MARNDEVAVLRDRRALQTLATAPRRQTYTPTRSRRSAARKRKAAARGYRATTFPRRYNRSTLQGRHDSHGDPPGRCQSRTVRDPTSRREDDRADHRCAGLGKLEAEGRICRVQHATHLAGLRPAMPTGCRGGETATMRWGRQRPEGGGSRIRDGKTGARTVPLTPEAAAVLGKVRRDRGSPGGSSAAHATGSRRDAGHVAGQAGGPGSVSRDRHRQPVHGPKAAEPQPGARRHPGPRRLAVRRRRHRMTFSVCRFDRIGTRSHYRTVEWTS